MLRSPRHSISLLDKFRPARRLRHCPRQSRECVETLDNNGLRKSVVSPTSPLPILETLQGGDKRLAHNGLDIYIPTLTGWVICTTERIFIDSLLRGDLIIIVINRIVVNLKVQNRKPYIKFFELDSYYVRSFKVFYLRSKYDYVSNHILSSSVTPLPPY